MLLATLLVEVVDHEDDVVFRADSDVGDAGGFKLDKLGGGVGGHAAVSWSIVGS